MFRKLVFHSWQMFRRSPFYEKSMFVKGFFAFLLFFILTQLYALGTILPVLLNEHFPQHTPGAWVYGFLFAILGFELLVRVFVQKTPSQQVRPYLHLPIPQSTMALNWLFRSWLHPFNFYMLVFFYSFVRVTINPETSSQALVLVGIFLLSALNQGVYAFTKSLDKGRIWGFIPAFLVAGMVLLAYTLFPDQTMELGLSIVLGFADANPVIFLSLIAGVVFFHFLAFTQVKNSFYHIFEQDSPQKAGMGNNPLEKWLASVPVYGKYWLLEWRLVTRNKRSRFNFYSMIPMSVGFMAVIGFWLDAQLETYMIIFLMLAGSYGGFHLQNMFSWESHFFDYLASRPFDLYTFIRAKFYFYGLYAALQWLLMIPLMLVIGQDVFLFYTGLFFYGCGVGFWLYMRLGTGNSTRFDANGKSAFNMEGISGMKMLMVILLFFSVIPVIIIAALISTEHVWTIASLLFIVIGLAFIFKHQSWIRNIGRRFENRKYVNLAIYRQK